MNHLVFVLYYLSSGGPPLPAMETLAHFPLLLVSLVTKHSLQVLIRMSTPCKGQSSFQVAAPHPGLGAGRTVRRAGRQEESHWAALRTAAGSVLSAGFEVDSFSMGTF